ncbi:hypothetical protein Poly30_37570 [Planctomycetes bacterium Poly30]|uniref:Uncharacterized protein n=1 Tax=Saltatorellus ferox TaxID=2528018 RepID=A0A518EVV3_9BACT|nr:hypothetical protein Poly30_37570 [Planctomycetes bacterium Poly30]
MATTWTISRRQGVCAKTGHEFGDGERHVSMLLVQGSALERMDVSMAAWREMHARMEAKDPEADEPLFWWMTRHEVTKRKTVQLDMESLSQLFVQLEGREEIQVRELRYVLCLLLMRKRRVKVEKVLRENGEESFLVKRPKEDQRYKVYVYDFEPERLDEVRAQLQAIFDGAEGPAGIRLSDGEESDEAASSVEGTSADETSSDDTPEDTPDEDSLDEEE